MSSGRYAPPLGGIIRHRGRIVGGFELSDPPQKFIEQFNRQYASLGLRAEAVAPSPPSPAHFPTPTATMPIGRGIC